MPAHPTDPKREARLAQALRDNLKRRKQQARAREEDPTPRSPEPTPPDAPPTKPKALHGRQNGGAVAPPPRLV